MHNGRPRKTVPQASLLEAHQGALYSSLCGSPGWRWRPQGEQRPGEPGRGHPAPSLMKEGAWSSVNSSQPLARFPPLLRAAARRALLKHKSSWPLASLRKRSAAARAADWPLVPGVTPSPALLLPIPRTIRPTADVQLLVHGQDHA